MSDTFDYKEAFDRMDEIDDSRVADAEILEADTAWRIKQQRMYKDGIKLNNWYKKHGIKYRMS